MSGKDPHLSDEIIIKAIVDESDLSKEARGHFSTCHRCRDRKEIMERNLSRLTSAADELMPQPKRMVILEERDKGRIGWFSAPLAGAIIVIIALAGLSFFMPGSKSRLKGKVFTVAELTVEMEKHSLLVAEVIELEENIMPEIYSALTGNADSNQYDEFIDFVFPMGEEINGA
ncbi:MAG: hypothetical protein OEV42_12650 [Deltaproteobacteria bacterium]|nr:hypothetical protein [Deltaproteobacteria bacterium]